MPGEKTTTTVPTTTGYWPGRSYAGLPGGWNPAGWGGRSLAGYHPGAWNGANAWNNLRRSQLGYGHPATGWNPAGWGHPSGWNGLSGAFNPVV